MSDERKDKIDQLADALERLWFGGGGEWGVATDANQRVKMRKLLHELLGGDARPANDGWINWTWTPGKVIPLAKGTMVEILDRETGRVKRLGVGSIVWQDYVEDKAFVAYRVLPQEPDA